MDRQDIEQAISTLSRELYRGEPIEREEIRDQLAKLLRVADHYLKENGSALSARHLQCDTVDDLRAPEKPPRR